MSFQDYFSQQANDYVRYRPHYPEALFEYLSRLASNHSTAWDCGTGNGQAALRLVKYFERVYATDASPQQIANALLHPRLDYFICLAESTPFASSSLDLIAAAQALHWFEAGRFFAEAKRVLKPEGILAVWCYGLFSIPEAPHLLTSALQDFYQQVDPFWPPERQLIAEEYATIPFPFIEIETPAFSMKVNWDCDRLIGYLKTWSATQKYLAHHGQEKLEKLFAKINSYWGSKEAIRQMQWPLYLRVGKKQSG